MLLAIYCFYLEFLISTRARYFLEELTECINSFVEATNPLSASIFYFVQSISLNFELSYLSNYCLTNLFFHLYSILYSAGSNYCLSKGKA
jgi:hypothetical protein